VRLAGVLTDPQGLGPHDHVCWVYDAPQDYAETARNFLLEGLRAGERLLCIGDVAVRSATRGPAALPHASALVRSGRLDLLRSSETSADERAGCSVADQLHFYSSAVERARADGYTGLRVAAEVTELASEPSRWAEHLRWEHLADRFIATDPGMATLCAYRAGAVDDAMLTGLGVLHPLTGGVGPVISFRLFFDCDALVLTGDIDSFCVERLAFLLRATQVSGSEVTLDVSRLGFIDGAGTAALADWGRALADGGMTLRLRGASPAFRQIWAVLGLGNAAHLVD
jgi:ABC-type transporter Mla MlaB component